MASRRVAIVGGGVVGAAIAYELSRVGVQIVLLEAADAFASQSTGAALGVLMGAISRKTKGRAWQLRQTSMRRYQTLIPELEALTGQTIPFNDRGILKLIRSAEDWAKWDDDFLALRATQGWLLERWGCDRLAARQPHLRLDGCRGAIYSPQDGQVDPVRLAQTLVAGARAFGADCRTNVRVLDLPCQGNGSCDRILTTAGEFTCEAAIVTAGLGSVALTTTAPSFRLQPVLGQARRVRLPTMLHPGFEPAVTCDDVHWVPLGNAEYWVGATVEFPEGDRTPAAIPAELERVWAAAIEFCPALAQAEVLQEWSGLRPRPVGQGAPVIQPLTGYDNVWLATGHYRNGVLLAPATALKIRDLML